MDIVQFPDPGLLLPHQAEVLNDPHRFKVLVWHRRSRKTTTSIYEIVRQAHVQVGVYWHIFPRYSDAKDAVWRDPNMLFRIIPEDLIKQVNASELVIYFKNGSIYQLKGSDDPDALRGANPMGVIFDEFDTQRDESWPTVEPILRANGGWAWFIGTPRGKQKLYQFFQRGQKENEEWKSWLLKATESGIIPERELDKSRELLSRSMFNQEYLCEFLEGEGGVFRGVREVAVSVPSKPLAGHRYLIGCDLAKVRDYTVLTVYDRENNRQVNQDRFQTLEWPFQKARIKSLSDIYNRAIVVVDATGLGNPIVDDLLRAGVPVETVKITAITKAEMIEKLSIWIDQHKIAILPMEETLVEFDNFGYTIGEGGATRYGGMNGFHDDIVMSHALAVYHLNDVVEKIPEYEETLIQKHKRRKGLAFGEWEDIWDEW